jgi:hypothetical protein
MWLWAALLGALPAWTAPEEKVLLRWKVAPEKPVAFRAAFTEAAKPLLAGLDWDGLNEGRQDVSNAAASGVSPERLKQVEGLLSNLVPPQKYPNTLLLRTTSEKAVSAKLIMNDPPAGPVPAGAVQLRGEIDDAGSLRSFHLPFQQKNLLAFFLELPKDPVQAGDAWPLQVNLISMGHGFLCRKMGRTNQVRLSAITKGPGGEPIAVLDYVVVETVEGEFKMPTADKAEPAAMKMAFLARGEFSIPRGKWLRFRGRLKSTATGVMTTDVEQDLALEPLEEIPEALLKAE